jgi:uncharacterized membrane protein
MAVQPLYQQQTFPAQKQRIDVWMHKTGAFLLEYWALLITIILGIIVLAALSVPFLSYLGLDSIAKPIFFALHAICAQIPSHSFYILGHQLCMCERNFSIYASMFAGSLIFTLSKKRLPSIPWWIWVLMILPIAFDGITQMFGLRESTWQLRILTGTLFGLGNMWFALPFIQKTLKETTPTYPPTYIPVIQSVQYAPGTSTSFEEDTQALAQNDAQANANNENSQA